MDGKLDITLYGATGNRFALADLAHGDVPPSPEELARELCPKFEVDGLLLVLAPEAGGACRMVLFNADGSRAEACGNGLRCVTRVARERGYAPGPRFVVETDAGPRKVEALEESGVIGAARVELGVPEVRAVRTRLAVDGALHEVGIVSLGNPHCVLVCDDVDSAPVTALGERIERHERFPERTNVAFVSVDGSVLRVRVWERGVGETASCGTGAAAASVIALRRGLVRSPVTLQARGGDLTVSWDGEGPLFLAGTVEEVRTEPQQFVTSSPEASQTARVSTAKR